MSLYSTAEITAERPPNTRLSGSGGLHLLSSGNQRSDKIFFFPFFIILQDDIGRQKSSNKLQYLPLSFRIKNKTEEKT